MGFGKNSDTRFKEIRQTPGPGSYDMPPSLQHEGSCFGKNSDTRFKEIRQTPGPGSYGNRSWFSISERNSSPSGGNCAFGKNSNTRFKEIRDSIFKRGKTPFFKRRKKKLKRK